MQADTSAAQRRALIYSDMPAVGLHDIAHHRQADALAGNRAVGAHAARQHGFTLRRFDAGTVVLYLQEKGRSSTGLLCAGLQTDLPVRELAGVVEQVAAQLQQVRFIAAEVQIGFDIQ